MASICAVIWSPKMLENVMENMTLEVRGGRLVYDGMKRRGERVVALVLVADDAFSRDVLAQLKWSFTNGYVATSRLGTGGRGRDYLHRIVCEHYHGPIPAGFVVDHIDRNTLNALPSNLRAVPPVENSANRGDDARNVSGYRGVSVIPQTGRWRAKYHIKGQKAHLGVFGSKEEAAQAVNRAHLAVYPDIPPPNPGVGEVGHR